MKDNLEKVFKEKLDQFEAPYDASAWDAMNDRLDARQSGGNNLLKWISGSAALVAVIAVSTYFLTKEDTSPENNKRQITEQKIDETANTEIKNHSSNETSNSENAVKEDEKVKSSNITNNDNRESEESANVSAVEVNDESPKYSSEESTVSVEASEESEIPNHIQSSTPETSEEPQLNYITGSLTNSKVCLGESIFIRNSGAKNEIIKIQIEGQILSLKKAQVHEYTPKQSGTIIYLDEENNVIGEDKFTVFENPNPDFSMKANLFENGLPITKCETYGDYESIVWTFGKDEIKSNGRRATHHFYRKGDHNVTLTVEDFNGCKNSVTKKIRIEDDYNLMAVDAFKPNGTDPRNKLFMPFSLTQRDVQFTLSIVDPRDNGIVYTTKDATKGWDGHDQRTGKMTPSETVYIWKVQLENPMPNERQVYAGTVVHN